MSEAFEKGIKIFGEVYGDDQANELRAYLGSDTDGFGKLQAQWAMEWAFGTIWSREEQLSRKMRSCAVLGMVIGMGTCDEIKMHTKMGTANGLTRDEIQEIYYSAIPYCGLPKSNLAKAAMIEGFKELDEDKAELRRGVAAASAILDELGVSQEAQEETGPLAG